MDGKKDDGQFNQFLTVYEPSFIGGDWDVIRFVVGYAYYNSVAKDTLGLLEFTGKYPVIYKNYFTALYSSMIGKGQLTPETLDCFCEWADLGINEETAFDLIMEAAGMYEGNNDMTGYRKYL